MSDVMAERYGTRDPRHRKLLVAATTALAVVFLAWLTWAAVFHSTPPLDASVTAFDIVDTHEIRVKVQARIADDEVEGSCLLRATAEDHNIVGELNVSAAELRAQEGQWISVRTERRATTIELVRCTGRD